MSRPCILLLPSTSRVLSLPLVLLILLSAAPHGAVLSAASTAAAAPTAATSTNTWVVLASTSRYWFNYRHTANALSMYRIVKSAGVPDSHILLLLPDDFACQPRNGPHAASMFNSASHSFNLYSDDDVEVDYRGSAVSVESLLRLLHGRHSEHVAKRQRLLSDERSNVLLYLSGHGGNEFLKFQDAEELSSTDIGLAVQTMYAQRRFHRLLMVSDTCQAESLHSNIQAPGVMSIAASRVGENSYSSSLDPAVGLSLIDRFTDSMLDFFERRQSQYHAQQNSSIGSGSSNHWMSRVSVDDLVRSLDPARLLSHPVTRTDLFPSELSETPLTAFFAADHQPHVSSSHNDMYHGLPAATRGELSAQPLSTHSSLSNASYPAVSSTLLAGTIHAVLRLSLPSVSSDSLRRQLRSREWLTSHRSESAAAWSSVSAAVCVVVAVLCWQLEQTSTRKHLPAPLYQPAAA